MGGCTHFCVATSISVQLWCNISWIIPNAQFEPSCTYQVHPFPHFFGHHSQKRGKIPIPSLHLFPWHVVKPQGQSLHRASGQLHRGDQDLPGWARLGGCWWMTCLHPQNLGEGLPFWINHNPKGHRSVWDNNYNSHLFVKFPFVYLLVNFESIMNFTKKLPSTTKDQLGKTQVNKESRPIRLRGSHCKPQRRGIDWVRTSQGRLNVTIWRVFSHISSWCVLFPGKCFRLTTVNAASLYMLVQNSI